MDSLAELIRERSQPLEPIATDAEAQLTRLEGIRAVVFDIYGTLIVSAAGDISLAEESARDDVIRSAIEGAGLTFSRKREGLAADYHGLIREAQSVRREEGIEYPEVEIREVWREMLGRLAEEEFLTGSIGAGSVETIAVSFECASNPVWPMPFLEETLDLLRRADLKLGIVSNAQFYTPLLFPAFLGQSLAGLGFSEPLQAYSYQHREGKPSVRLYEIAAAALHLEGIETGEALYVGNDMRNDIWPAQAVGFKTALFAGDRRSLRMREGDGRISGVTPDVILTELSQIEGCLGLRDS